MLWYGYLTFLGRVLRYRSRANPVLRSDLLLTVGISGISHLISISSSSIARSIALNLAFATATFLFAARIAKSFIYSARSRWCLRSISASRSLRAHSLSAIPRSLACCCSFSKNPHHRRAACG